ncbi:MAG TPA: alpha/beta hydrolase [Bdellovibrio sp.]|uniref:alpha/beta fold hydrolase n=1 Tax=Bdellovibrio sp. TaxID=28201 RepID=UPI002EFF6549
MKMLSLILFVLSFQWSSAFAMNAPRYINYNGIKLAMYESAGKHGPAILLIHGNTSSARSFEKIIDSPWALYQKIVAIDMPGYGRSENAPTYNVALMVGAIAKAAQISGADHGVVVGWSLGGDFVLQAAASLPDVKGFFIFGTAPVGADTTLPPAFLSPTESYAGNAVNYGFIPNLTTQQVNDYVTAFFRPHYNSIPNAFYTDGQRTDPATRAAVYVAATGGDPTFVDEIAVVRSMTTPIAIAIGSKDAFVNPEFLADLAPSIPHLYKHKIFTFPNSGHAIQWEHPLLFISFLQTFVWDVTH